MGGTGGIGRSSAASGGSLVLFIRYPQFALWAEVRRCFAASNSFGFGGSTFFAEGHIKNWKSSDD
jgi:hypothetical protein